MIAVCAGVAVSVEPESGMTLTVKADRQQEDIGEKKQKTRVASKKLAPGQMVNINTSSKAELEALPGIGAKKARSIIDGRPYKSKEDLMKVKGISKRAFKGIKDIITIQ